MPQRKCAVKRLRADVKRQERNFKLKRDFKKSLKTFLSLVSTNKAQEAKAGLKAIIAKIDKAVSKGIIHKNTAARRKSQFVRRVQALK